MSYGEVLRDKSTMHIRVTLYRGYLIVLRLFHMVCILYCGCFDLSRNMWLCVSVGFVMCGCLYVWVLYEWVCVCVGFVMCGCVYVWIL